MSIASQKTWTVAAGIAAIAALASPGLAGVTKHKETRVLTAVHVEHSPISVGTTNGSISIRTHDGKTVRITAHLVSRSAERLRDARVAAERQKDGTLAIACAWPDDKPKNGDGCSFDVLVPDAYGVKADTANGSITIIGLAGDLVADTSNGSISIEGHSGPIDADTSNGSISVSDVTGKVKADTSNGSISVSLTDTNPGPVNLDTSNGSITLQIGRAFVGSVHADTSVGRVHIGPFPEEMSVEVADRDKHSCRVIFGGSKAPKSVLDTSVGSVTVKARRQTAL